MRVKASSQQNFETSGLVTVLADVCATQRPPKGFTHHMETMKLAQCTEMYQREWKLQCETSVSGFAFELTLRQRRHRNHLSL